MNKEPDLLEQLKELRRERKLRSFVYPKWIEGGRLKPADAAWQLACLDAAIVTLARLCPAEDGRLL